MSILHFGSLSTLNTIRIYTLYIYALASRVFCSFILKFVTRKHRFGFRMKSEFNSTSPFQSVLKAEREWPIYLSSQSTIIFAAIRICLHILSNELNFMFINLQLVFGHPFYIISYISR